MSEKIEEQVYFIACFQRWDTLTIFVDDIV